MADDTRVPSRYVWITAGLAVASLLWYLLFSTVGAGHVAIAYVAVPLEGLVAVAALFRLWRRVRSEPVAGRFWRALLIAAVFMTVGYVLMLINAARFSAGDMPPDMPLSAAVAVGLGFALAMWAVARVPQGAVSPAERWRMHLDRVVAFLGCATVLWHFGLAPMLTATERWSPQTLTLVGLAFLLTIGGITKVSYLGDGPVDRTAMRLVATMGLAAAGVAVLATTFGNAGGVPSQSVVLPMAPVLLVLAVRAQGTARLGRRRVSRRSSPLLPYLAIAGGDLPLIAIAAGPLQWPGRVSLLAAVLVSVLVTIRQFVAFRDNKLLLRDIRGQEVRLQHEVSHDGLTGLANRARFRDALHTALENGESATVLLVDLDDFKTVNDSLGHDVGDRLLVAVAHVLDEACGTDALPVRIGGDEFAALLVGGTTVGETVAQRILDALESPISEHRLLVQASIGIATAAPAATVDGVLRDADVSMYAAKQRGKAGFVRYEPGMEQPVLAHIQLGGEIRRGLDEGEFRVVYQPVVLLETGKVIGVEALVRWEHPTRGTVPPIEFIPAAERTGLIVELGRFVLRETCRQTAAWLAEFGPDALQKPGVNVSARQLHDPGFVADVLAALADSGLSTDRLVLELTESAVLRGSQISRTLHELDRHGVKLALDDFGTGESSLSLLRAFPAAIIKLDKSFVDGIEIDDANPAARDARQAVARAVIQLAGALGLDTVAEGIENEAQVEQLRALGYTLGQGYHLARPMNAGNFTALLASQRDAVAA
ncbi:putative bifunctional diguanylate cyclase/phosphodiesterase [Actinoplanes friuliensis]|uniref:Putative signaling protein n=1 Tax=Actinoplanes friuliensis DSM 7358 TaxID=1246995 RepID=U5W3I8_9ACTN|nr:EAL domain-containing protein [Actinoplanes friuliensis]AGZ43783.1 putative signaling protein [Actinoplanes friuliensis DSM 7358]